MLKTEKNHLGLDLKQARDELDRLRYNMDDLKELNVELQKSKEAGESSTASLSEISRECEDLKKELSRVHADSKIEMERARAEYSSEISLALSTLEEKQKELEKVKEQLQSAVSQAELSKIRSNDDLMARCIRAEEELCQEREKRLTAEQSMNSFQNGLCREFVGALSDGKRLLHEAVKSVTALEQEVDGLKAECDASNLREEDTKNAIVELKRACDEQKDVMQKIVEKAQLDLEEVMKERDEARRGLSEAQQMALKIEGEKEALAGKKQEAESRASKVENELKVVRELEERAKVEAEEAIHEQEAMRRSWEMQREQIESMSREIERLKKAEDGLIRVLKEVGEEVKNKEIELTSLNERAEVEKRALEEEIKKYSRELSLMREGHESWMDSGKMKEELEGLKHAKENLEKRLIEAERGESMVVDRQTRIVELEEEIAELKSGYSMSIASREEEHEEELSSYSEKIREEFEYIRGQYVVEINGLRDELFVKDKKLEYRLEQWNKLLNEKEVEIGELRRMLEEQKIKTEQLIEKKSKWMSDISKIRMKNKETLAFIKNQWKSENRELEITSIVAMAAVENRTRIIRCLMQYFQAQARELSETKRKYCSEILELRHLLSMQKRPSLIDPEKSNLDDSTELEYLRNILYEYMMGKEPVVLAKVIAAVVKFDDEQTKKILVKEEQKQTLLGQFGLT